jgi:hypothetical protein
MIINTIENAKRNYVKLHCPQCEKTLSLEDFDLEPFAPGIIDLIETRGEIHEARHKTHHPQVYIYQRGFTDKVLRE